jgi:hypothetical protein
MVGVDTDVLVDVIGMLVVVTGKLADRLAPGFAGVADEMGDFAVGGAVEVEVLEENVIKVPVLADDITKVLVRAEDVSGVLDLIEEVVEMLFLGEGEIGALDLAEEVNRLLVPMEVMVDLVVLVGLKVLADVWLVLENGLAENGTKIASCTPRRSSCVPESSCRITAPHDTHRRQRKTIKTASSCMTCVSCTAIAK